jgi:hypothetical protein
MTGNNNADPTIIERSTRFRTSPSMRCGCGKRRVTIMQNNAIRVARSSGNPTEGTEWITTFL